MIERHISRRTAAAPASRRPLMAAATGLGLAAMTLAGPALANPSGLWTTGEGKSRVEIAPCGGAFCGTIVWAQDPSRTDVNGKPVVGQRILTDLKETGANRYKGKVYNPEDGKTYSGVMTLNGGSAELKGCVLGVLCRSQTWAKN